MIDASQRREKFLGSSAVDGHPIWPGVDRVRGVVPNFQVTNGFDERSRGLELALELPQTGVC